MAILLQLFRAGSGAAAVLLIGKALDFSTDGQPHEPLSYVITYGVGAVFAAAAIGFTVAIERRKRAARGPAPTKSPPPQDLEPVLASEPEAKHRALSMLDELHATDGVVATALENGHWWDTAAEGLHDDAWRVGSHALGDRAPRVRAKVAPAYTTAVQRNREANSANRLNGPAPPLGAADAKRLEQLRTLVAGAIAALQDYCGLTEAEDRERTLGNLADAERELEAAIQEGDSFRGPAGGPRSFRDSASSRTSLDAGVKPRM